jgi:hypothetical protein
MVKQRIFFFSNQRYITELKRFWFRLGFLGQNLFLKYIVFWDFFCSIAKSFSRNRWWI